MMKKQKNIAARAIKADPNNLEPQNNLGETYLRLERLDEDYEILESVLQKPQLRRSYV